MQNMNTPNCRIEGVHCTVETCMYHAKDNSCCAKSIQVGNENANRQAETLCSTYQHRATM